MRETGRCPSRLYIALDSRALIHSTLSQLCLSELPGWKTETSWRLQQLFVCVSFSPQSQVSIVKERLSET